MLRNELGSSVRAVHVFTTEPSSQPQDKDKEQLVENIYNLYNKQMAGFLNM